PAVAPGRGGFTLTELTGTRVGWGSPQRWSYLHPLTLSQVGYLHPLTLSQVEVSQGSEVRFQSGNFSVASQVLPELLPHGNDHLLSWALKKYGGLTSFLELRMTQDIHLNVGEDLLLLESCRITLGWMSLNYMGAYKEPTASRGCVLWGPDQDPEVHIIELETPDAGR
ncbi:unnamed protein product, partial [Gadus morhua 'NCC']